MDRENGLECAVCLSLFEDKEKGRKLPECGHGFHVECIDMWLSSHSNCPICRAGVRVFGEGNKGVEIDLSSNNGVVIEESALEIVVHHEVVSSLDSGNSGVEVVLSDSSSAPLSSQVCSNGWILQEKNGR